MEEIICAGKEIHPIESKFFSELMVLCAQYGVTIRPDIIEEDEVVAEIDGKDVKFRPAIVFDFNGSVFVNDMDYEVNPEFAAEFINRDDERDYISISGVPCDERKIWYSKINKEAADKGYEIVQNFNNSED